MIQIYLINFKFKILPYAGVSETHLGFTVLQGSELFVKLKSQKAQKTANLDLFVNLILQIEFAQFLE